MQTNTEPLFMNDIGVSQLLSVSVSTVRRWRLTNQGPKWIRVSASAIRYSHLDVCAYLASRPSGGQPDTVEILAEQPRA
jgi:predicted DNA-binding transcriptional regulator AlpA